VPDWDDWNDLSIQNQLDLATTEMPRR
jgi:hypothetical protein